MTREERAARAAEKAVLKAARRQANKDNWKYHPANANAAWMQREAELKSAIGPEIEPVSEEGSSSASLAKLRIILADTSAALHRRLDAADIIIDFELAPGAAVGVPPDQIGSAALAFYRAVESNPQTPEALKFRALKAIARIENSRAQAVQSPQSVHANREFHRRLINSARSAALREAGTWAKVVASGASWALKPSDAFDIHMLQQPSVGASIEKDGSGDYLDGCTRWRRDKPAEAERHDADRQAVLLAIKATNREDDWQRLLVQAERTSA